MRRWILPLVGILLLIPAIGHAQYYGGYRQYGLYDDYDYLDDYGYRSSTAEEGYGRGLADIIRSRGIYNRLRAEALVKQEEARREWLENYQKGVETYFQTRELNRKHRAVERAQEHADVREWLENRTPSQPRRLSPSELDSNTGDIDWPILLRASDYSQQREILERTFRQWADREGRFSPEGYQMVLTTGEDMLRALKERVDDVPPMDYIAAKRFVQALTNEAKFPSD